MGSSAVAASSLPPLPQGATLLSAAAPPTGGLPPLPPGAKLATSATTATPHNAMLSAWQPTELERLEDSDLSDTGGPEWLKPVEAVGAGVINSGAHMLGNVLDMVGKAVKARMDPMGIASRMLPDGMAPLPPSDKDVVMKHVQDAANYLRGGRYPNGFWENLGAVGEQTIEWLGGGELLKLAGPAAGTVEASEHLKQSQQIAQVLKANPKLAGLVTVGLKASKDALLLGGQTYAHTEDPEQAALAAVTAGTLRAGGEGVASAGRYLKGISPAELEIAGEKIPALQSQVGEGGKPIAGGAEAAPKIAEAQQAAGQRAMQSTAQNATEAALNKVNATRPVYEAVAGRPQLPAPEGAEPFTFTMEGAAPAGEAGEAQGGQLKTTSPQEAQSWLRQIEDVQDSPEHENLSKTQQAAIERQRQALSDQLGLYHSSPYAQRFSPADIPEAVGHVRTWGDAAAQVKGAATPVYQVLDRVSNGEFSAFNGQIKAANRVIRSATSMDAVEAAEARKAEANGKIQELFVRHASELSPADYRTAQMAWRDGSLLDNLHTVTERMMNGITAEETERGFTRVMTGNTKSLEKFLATGTNRAQLEGLIGQDGVDNLKQVTTLLSKASTARATTEVGKQTAMALQRYMGHAGWAALAGGAIVHAMGGSFYAGTLSGALLDNGVRLVLRDAATNPRIGKLLDFAVRNGVSPKIYAPLIARAITVPLQDKPAEEEQPEEQGQEPEAAEK